jgi:hypothetical protein
MEVLGLLFAVPVTMIPSAAYTALAIWAFGRWPTLKSVAVPISCVVALLLVIEVVLLVSLGPKSSYSRLHHAYTLLHFSVFLLAPPAIANLVLHLTLKKEKKKWFQFAAAAACCWVACMFALLGNIMVDEAIMGVDAGKPFYMSKTEPNQTSQRNAMAWPISVFESRSSRG